jgi:hypothetical protein
MRMPRNRLRAAIGCASVSAGAQRTAELEHAKKAGYFREDADINQHLN